MINLQEVKIEEKTELEYCSQCAKLTAHTVRVLYGVESHTCECGLKDFVAKVVSK